MSNLIWYRYIEETFRQKVSQSFHKTKINCNVLDVNVISITEEIEKKSAENQRHPSDPSFPLDSTDVE